MRRAAASISPNVKSATVSVSTPGVRVTRPWHPAASLRSSSGDGGSSSRRRRTSACCESSSSAPPGSGRVTRTVGRVTLAGHGWPALVRLYPAAEPRLIRRLLAAELVVVHPVVPVVGAKPLHHGQRAEDGACGLAVVVLGLHPLHDAQRLLALAAHLGDVFRYGVDMGALQRYRHRLA